MQRGLHTAIIDEADNVLIDEAVTPLIISKNNLTLLSKACALSTEIAQKLQLDIHYKKMSYLRTLLLSKTLKKNLQK